MPPKKRKTSLSDDGGGAGNKKTKQAPKKSKTTLPGVLDGKELTAITYTPLLDVLYTPSIILHFDNEDPAFQVVIKAGAAGDLTAADRRDLQPDVDMGGIEAAEKPQWMANLLRASGPSEKELSDEKYDNPSVLFKHVFDEPLEIVEATYVSKSRPCVKPVIAPRRKGAEKDVKVLRISFQGHEDEGIDIRATKAKYHYEDMVEKAADYEIEWPVDVDVKKSKA